MKKAFTKDGRLARLMKICLALPEAIQEPAARHATFLVRKDVFAYYLNDHHGDGIVSVCCKVLPGDNQALVAARPAKFYMPAYIGPRGWVALRLDIGGVDWNEVAELVVQAIIDGTFLVLPHPEVLTFLQRKTADYDRWLRGMRRLRLEPTHTKRGNACPSISHRVGKNVPSSTKAPPLLACPMLKVP